MNEKIKLISPEPKLAITLSKREIFLLPKEIYDEIITFMAEVGSLMRSREFIVSTTASYASHGVILLSSDYFPILKRLGIISRALGIAE